MRGLGGKNPSQTSLNVCLSNHFSNRRNCGRPQKFDSDKFAEFLKTVPRKKRRTLRDLQEASKISIGSVHRLVKMSTRVKPHTSALKPKLTEENKMARVAYSLDKRLPTGLYGEILDNTH